MRMMLSRRVDGTGVGAVCSASVFVRIIEDAIVAFVILSGSCCRNYRFGKNVRMCVIDKVTSEQQHLRLKPVVHGLMFQRFTINAIYLICLFQARTDRMFLLASRSLFPMASSSRV